MIPKLSGGKNYGNGEKRNAAVRDQLRLETGCCGFLA